MQLIDDASSAARQICSALVEQGEDLDGTLRIDRADVTLRDSDACRCGRIDPVIRAPAAAGEFPNPGGGGRRDIEDDLPDGQQPLSQVTTETVGVLDRPGALRPGLGPGDPGRVAGAGGVDADRAEVGVGGRADRGGGVLSRTVCVDVATCPESRMSSPVTAAVT